MTDPRRSFPMLHLRQRRRTALLTHPLARPSGRPSSAHGIAAAAATALAWLVPLGLALALAFGIGTSSARALLEREPGAATANGAWRVLPSSGGTAVDPYTRARLSRGGTVPLGSAEGVALSTARDSRGRALDARCRYLLRGPMPPARRWSLWVEPRSDDPARPGALHSQGLVRERGGGFVIEASAAVRPGNWLALAAPPPGGQLPAPFTLRLALYDTPVARTGRADALAPPTLRRIGCDNAATLADEDAAQ